MKFFTHVFVIYDNGWKFEWEPKEPQKPFDMIKQISLLVIYGVALAYFTGVMS